MSDDDDLAAIISASNQQQLAMQQRRLEAQRRRREHIRQANAAMQTMQVSPALLASITAAQSVEQIAEVIGASDDPINVLRIVEFAINISGAAVWWFGITPEQIQKAIAGVGLYITEHPTSAALAEKVLEYLR